MIDALLIAYVLGSIPFGLLLTRAAGLGDVRNIGSGNIGATNVMRTGNKFLGVATLLLDAAKGFAAIKCAQFLHVSALAELIGFVAVLGHVFPVWLHFKGGKGVATAIGVLFAIDPVLGLAVCVMWLAAFGLIRIASLASMLAVGYSPIVAYLLDDDITALLCFALALLIVYTHRGNISRLLEGTEHRFKGKSA